MAQEVKCLDPRHPVRARTCSSSLCSPSYTSSMLIRKLLIGLLEHLVSIRNAWSRHSQAVKENSWKERSSWPSCLCYSQIPLPGMGHSHVPGYRNSDFKMSWWVFISLGWKPKCFRIHFRNSAQSLHSECSFLESILQVSILTFFFGRWF